MSTEEVFSDDFQMTSQTPPPPHPSQEKTQPHTDWKEAVEAFHAHGSWELGHSIHIIAPQSNILWHIWSFWSF